MTSRRLLITGILLGVAAVVLLNVYVARVRASQSSVSVLRLKPGVSLARGESLGPGMMEPLDLPESFGDVVARAIPASGEASVWLTDRPVTRDVPAGSVLLYEHFEDVPDERFAARVGDGMRAVTIPVDSATAVGFFVEPGSRVDVLVTLARIEVESQSVPGGRSVPTTSQQVATSILLQNVRVLAVGRATSRGAYLGELEEGFGTVTVEVTPLQAEKLVFAMEHARRGLTLALRNPSDEKDVRLPSVDWSSLDGAR